MKILHIIPGLDAGASKILKDEHSRALESISQAVGRPSKRSLDLRVVEICDPSWPASDLPGLEVFRQPIEVCSVQKGGGIRPKLRSFFPQSLLEDADFVVFTNSDICVVPEFYDTVAGIIEEGTLAGSIHRKTILGLDPSEPESVPEAIDSVNWYLHPGSDCFFFPTATAVALRDNQLVLGIPPVGRLTIFVLSALNPSFRKFPALGITFHFGDDRVWQLSASMKKLTGRNYRNWYLALPRVRSLAGAKGFARAMATVRVVKIADWVNLFFKAMASLIKGAIR